MSKLFTMDNKIMTDDSIVSLLLSNDEQGLRLLYRNYSSAIFGIISRIVPTSHEADEVLNDTFLKIYKNISSYDKDKSKLFTWMARIARNAAIDKRRSADFKQGQNTISLDSLPNYDSSYSESKNMDQGLSKMIASMDADLRQILEYVYLMGYSHQDCADELNIPLGTVKTKVRRAILILREGLKDDLVHLTGLSIILALVFYTLNNLI